MKSKAITLLSLTMIIFSMIALSSCDNNDDTDSGYQYTEPAYSETLEFTINFDGTAYSVTGVVNKSIKELEIPEEFNELPVTSIGRLAFYDCKSLVKIIIPNTITHIGDDAFSGCSKLTYNEYDNSYYLGNTDNPYLILKAAKDKDIDSCEINNNTTVIYYDAFYDCTKLTSITIPGSVKSIGEDAFYGCTGLTSITIPSSVTLIDNSAFKDCKGIKSVIFEQDSRLESISYYAFDNCTELTSINFGETTEKWLAISKGPYWNRNTGEYTVYCTNGTVSKDGTVTKKTR